MIMCGDQEGQEGVEQKIHAFYYRPLIVFDFLKIMHYVTLIEKKFRGKESVDG